MCCFRMKSFTNQFFIGCRWKTVYRQLVCVTIIFWTLFACVAAGRVPPVFTMHNGVGRLYPRQSYCLDLLELIEDTGGFNGKPVMCQKHLCRHYDNDKKMCASNGQTTKTFRHQCALCARSCQEMNKLQPTYRLKHEGECTEEDFTTTTTTTTTTMRSSTRRPITTTVTPSTETKIAYKIPSTTYSTSYTTYSPSDTTYRPSSTTNSGSTTNIPSSTTTYTFRSTTHGSISSTYRASPSTLEQTTMEIIDTSTLFTTAIQNSTIRVFGPETEATTNISQDFSTEDLVDITTTSTMPTTVQIKATVSTPYVVSTTDDKLDTFRSTTLKNATTHSPNTTPAEETSTYHAPARDIPSNDDYIYEGSGGDFFMLEIKQELRESDPLTLRPNAEHPLQPVLPSLQEPYCVGNDRTFKVKCSDKCKDIMKVIEKVKLPDLPSFYKEGKGPTQIPLFSNY